MPYSDPIKAARYYKKWAKKNEHLRKSARLRWLIKNQHRIKDMFHAWYLKNKPRVYAYMKKYNKNHPEVKTVSSQRRRARRRNAEGSFTPKEWLELKHKYKFRCLCCKKKKSLEPDHVIPLIKGGRNSIDNIQPLCKSCNCRKHIGTTDFR